MDNIVDLSARREEKTPAYYNYKVVIKIDGGDTATLTDYGYLVAYGPILGICRGPEGKGEFSTLINLADLLYVQAESKVETVN